MKLINTIKADNITALKNGEKDKLASLRLLIAELEKEKVVHKLNDVTDLTDEQTQNIVNREIKKINNAIEEYEKYGLFVTDKQKAEKELLLGYMPQQLTAEEVINEIKKAIGLVEKGEYKNPMQYLSKELKGKTDMKKVSKLIKELNK